MYKKYHKDTPVCLHLDSAAYQGGGKPPARDPVKARIPSEYSLAQLLSNRSHCTRRYSFGSGAFAGSLAGDCTIKVEANWGIFMIFLIHKRFP